MNEVININVRIVPVITFLLQRRYLYTLSDFSYGDWIIYENDEPKYYLNIFDPIYKEVEAFWRSSRGITMDMWLAQASKDNGLNLSESPGFSSYIFIRLDAQSELKEIAFERYPLSFFDMERIQKEEKLRDDYKKE